MNTSREGELIGGKYRLVSLLGEGGMGAVYTAVQEDIHRKVAVKLLHEHTARDQVVLERFRREAITAAELGHPNIIQVSDLQIDPGGGDSFLVMELLEGRSLEQEIDQSPMSVDRTVFIANQLLSALSAAHAAGIVHRDLKPDNVFLTHVAGVQDIVKLLDFGIAKLSEAEDRGKLTNTGAVLGTPAYMAPEQAKGLEITPQTDLFAVGGIMYSMLTGRPPHDGDTVHSLIYAVITGSRQSLPMLRPDIDPALLAIIERSLAMEPRDRFVTADEMAAALKPFTPQGNTGAQMVLQPQPVPALPKGPDVTTYPNSLHVGPEAAPHASGFVTPPSMTPPMGIQPQRSGGGFPFGLAGIIGGALGLFLLGGIVLALVALFFLGSDDGATAPRVNTPPAVSVVQQPQQPIPQVPQYPQQVPQVPQQGPQMPQQVPTSIPMPTGNPGMPMNFPGIPTNIPGMPQIPGMTPGAMTGGMKTALPATCPLNGSIMIDGQTETLTGTLIRGGINCTITIRNSKLVGDTVIEGALNTTITLENSTIEGRLMGIDLETNNKLYVRGKSLIKGQNAAIRGAVNAEVEIDGGEIIGVIKGIDGNNNLKVRASNALIKGEHAAISASTNSRITLTNARIEGKIAGIDVGNNARITGSGGHIKGENNSLKIGRNAEISLSGTKVTGRKSIGRNSNVVGL